MPVRSEFLDKAYIAEEAIEHRFVRAGSVKLHVAACGPADGHPVFLLHGFPDHWIGWRHQMQALSAGGYRVIMPDQRGYNTSDKPKGFRAYSLDKLVADIIALAEALEIRRFHLVGHDWGGIVAWALAASKPDRVDKLVILNAPHPDAVFRYALRSPTQFLRSSYAAFFQFPWLPETVLGAGDARLLTKTLVASARPGAFSDDDLSLYRRAWKYSGALTAMLNWYRALRYRPSYSEPIRAPTLVLWGKKDRALEPGLADASVLTCNDATIEYFPDATHWLHREEVTAVNFLILEFFAKA